ncbi:tripartite tricarboxylate transporter substrate-binding protein [Achromobacter sp. DMS1]|uniref:tripartite tricarboxylate transporter substrate-binding protein n=1 Tax=Achromobacter sp. DMS1 TaxID=1688405 RepID=UPI000AD7E36E|nr:tripartite tricarboxylate transporter substrate-binding protein [Achromobacter sp. DMS1]
MPGVEVPQWYAIFAPAKTDPAVVEKLNAALNQALADPQVSAKIGEQGAEVRRSSPAELGAFVQSEVQRWRQLASRSRLAAN